MGDFRIKDDVERIRGFVYSLQLHHPMAQKGEFIRKVSFSLRTMIRMQIAESSKQSIFAG